MENRETARAVREALEAAVAYLDEYGGELAVPVLKQLEAALSLLAAAADAPEAVRLESAARRAEYWKAELIEANKVIDSLRAAAAEREETLQAVSRDWYADMQFELEQTWTVARRSGGERIPAVPGEFLHDYVARILAAAPAAAREPEPAAIRGVRYQWRDTKYGPQLWEMERGCWVLWYDIGAIGISPEVKARIIEALNAPRLAERALLGEEDIKACARRFAVDGMEAEAALTLAVQELKRENDALRQRLAEAERAPMAELERQVAETAKKYPNHARLAQALLDKQGEINALRAEVERLTSALAERAGAEEGGA